LLPLPAIHSVYWRLLCVCVVVGAALALDGWQRPEAPPPASAPWPVSAAPADLAQLQIEAKGEIPMPPGMAAAHASTLLPMPADHAAVLTVFWFSGDRESGPNVQIAASQFDRASRQWSPARFVVNRFVMGEQLGHGLRRLGNPVAWMDGQGRINLFVVATGWGGWAASRILQLRQSSTGNGLAELAFAPVRVLPLSWLWNTSFLVRNAPLPLMDGGMVLPVHFELGIKYPTALRFDKEGGYLCMVRLSQRPYLLQPSLVAQSPQQWLAFMRDERPQGKIGVARTTDGGQHWSDLPDLLLDNPDAAVAGLGLSPGQMLLAHNSSIASRGTLDLSRSADGRTWALVKTLEQGGFDDEFSYPAMAWVDGKLWISYTVDRHRIAWQRLAPPLTGAKP
jgi:predicted neuraminidase